MGINRFQDSSQSSGPAEANELLPLIYDELRKLAAAKMAGERSGHTLNATALVHEAYLKLGGGKEDEAKRWNGRRHFYAAAAEAMRRILIDHARRKMADRRGGDWKQVTLGDHDAPQSVSPSEIIDLSEAMEKLTATDPKKAEVAKLSLFGGLTLVEIADVLKVSKPTVARRWGYAKAWLSRELGRDRT